MIDKSEYLDDVFEFLHNKRASGAVLTGDEAELDRLLLLPLHPDMEIQGMRFNRIGHLWTRIKNSGAASA